MFLQVSPLDDRTTTADGRAAQHATQAYNLSLAGEQSRWRPLYQRDEPDPGEVLLDGLPDHLLGSLEDWVHIAITSLAQRFGDGEDEVLHYIERSMKVGGLSSRTVLWQACKNDRGFGLQVTDVLVALLIKAGGPLATQTGTLDLMLSHGGSMWKVGEWEGHPGLIRRVDETVAARAALVMSGEGAATAHLRVAWVCFYRPDRDAAQTLGDVVKALEAAARPVVSPNDGQATLGKMISALRDKPGKWVVAVGDVNQVCQRLRDIWALQPRHGTDDPNAIREVPLEVVEAALHDAVTLVHWFQNGLIRRGDD